MPNSVPMRRMRSSISVRCIGSSPSVGSSRRTSSGSWAIAAASFTRCRWPGRHRADRAEALLAEPDEPERVVRPLHGGAAGEKVHLGEVPDEIGRGELRREIVVLRRVADAGSRLDSRSRGIAAEDGQLAVVARAETEDDGDERRLARTVRAEQPRDSGADVGVEARERDGAAEALDDPTSGDDGGRLGLSHAGE